MHDHLVDRSYHPETANCLSLVRDYYADNYDILIGDYAVPHDWDSAKLNLIEELHENEGFFKVDGWTLKNLRPGDVLAVAVRSTNPNHFVIYVGDNQILHQPLMQMSRVETLRDFWRMATCFVLRHPDVPYTETPLPLISMEEVLRARLA